jgi:predicted acetyltransferase
MPTPMGRIRPFEYDRDEAPLRRIVARAFGGPDDAIAAYFELVGREHLRVLDETPGGPQIAAGLARMTMGHWFGGRSVPCLGIAAVAVAPEARGGGRARELMRGIVREAHDEGTPLLSLYASTQALYRQVGFEQAGTRCEFRVPLRQLTGGSRDGAIEEVHALVDDEPNPRLVACYRAFAERFDGMLDRSRFVWSRIQRHREHSYHGLAFVPEGPGGPIEGYVFLAHVRRDDGRFDIAMSDCAFATPRAGQRILGLLRDYASMGVTLTFFGGASHPLLMLLPQQWFDVQVREYSMLRIARFADAIAARGYAPTSTGSVVCAVEDDLVAENTGRFEITVREGRGVARPTTATPAFSADIRTWASIYAGFLAPRQATLLGLAEGDDAAARALGGFFAGSSPWMTDMF